MSKLCYCCSELAFSECCAPYSLNIKNAPTAEVLMRSRYTAYAIQNADYLVETTTAATRKFNNKAAVLKWSNGNNWRKLEILFTSENVVEFKAFYFDHKLQLQIHHEKSNFVNEYGQWFYLGVE